jgi:hypothetical protein
MLGSSWPSSWRPSGSRILRLNTELSMLAGAVAGAVAHFHGLPVRHLVEGAFTYFDECLISSPPPSS